MHWWNAVCRLFAPPLTRAIARLSLAMSAIRWRFRSAGKRSRARNEQEFLGDYDRIFTAKFVERLRAAVPHNMFANAQGIMIADGAVWFDDKGRAVALNN